MKKIFIPICFLTLAYVATLFSSCSKITGPTDTSSRRDTCYSIAGQMLKDCAGKNLTITKGRLRLTETTIKPCNTTDSIVYRITIKGDDIMAVDELNNKYESEETSTFTFKAGPNSPVVFSWKLKLNLESKDKKIVKINFLIHSDVIYNQSIVVDKGIFDLTNGGCIVF